MNAVVLTFPGHFFQTILSIKSIQRWYQPSRWYLILDDISAGPWHDYSQDFENYLRDELPALDFQLFFTSDLTGFADCASGWWRQQLVKLTLDLIIDGDEWFVVDGDVVFDSHCDIKSVTPISRRTLGPHSPIAVLGTNYVKNLLGTEQGNLTVNGEYVLTNPVPFRWLSKELLQALRKHVEQRYCKDFTQLHLDWFRDQTIIAYEDPPVKMIMTEWELIECFRHFVLKHQWPLLEIGSGYPLYMNTSALINHGGLFRHGYMRDASIDLDWLKCQNITVPDDVWATCQEWQRDQEPWRK